MSAVVEVGRWFPQMPPKLDGEDDAAYTDRLTGADRTGRVPYDHVRNRQCSIGYHGECSERHLHRPPTHAELVAFVITTDRRCQCPCHTELGQAQMEARELGETVVILWAIATGQLSPKPGWRERLIDGEGPTVERIVAARPELATWYLAGRE